MFCRAISFNGDVSKWDVSSVTNMDHMFDDAHSFGRKLCGAAWVHSKASKKVMFAGSSGSITRKACTSAVTRRPLPDRELIVYTPITMSVSMPALTSTTTNTMTCPKCGTFERSGRVSCCAPGGGWFKNCGGAGNKNVEHRWIEGVEACRKRKFTKSGACGHILSQTKHSLF